MNNPDTDTTQAAQGPQIATEAIEAAALALEAWDRGVPWDIKTPDDIPPGYWDMWLSGARLALQAAWPHIHRRIPNTVEALDGLAEGAIIFTPGQWPWVRTGTGWNRGRGRISTSELALVKAQVTEWTVLWEGGEG